MTSARTSSIRPPGPRRPFILPPVFGVGENPLQRLPRMSRRYGDVVSFRAAGERMYLLSHPDHVHDVFVSQHKSFAKGRALERARGLLGDGLLTSEGDFHLRQRRLIQPAFHRERTAAFANVMTTHATRLTADWKDGDTRNLATEMMRLTLGIAAETLFSSSVDIDTATRVREAMNTVLHAFPLLMLPFGEALQKLPLPAMRRLKAARYELDGLIYRVIEARRRDGSGHQDLLSMLLAAQIPAADDSRQAMTDEQVRDEVMTILLAGHETTATALSWTWRLLAQHPHIEATLQAELRATLPDGRAPTPEDMPGLAFTEQVMSESLRLYPPVWLIGRRALQPVEIGGYEIPSRAIVIVSPWITQRDARWFREPERFRPERWTTEFKAELPKQAYFPFGGGPRLCIGEGFAWMEMVLVVAHVMRHWRFEPLNDAAVEPEALVTLRPKGGLPMRVWKRKDSEGA